MIRSVALAGLAAIALAQSACGNPPNFLDGSIKTSHSLDFDEVELRYLSDQGVYQIVYTDTLENEAGEQGGQDIVAKITFNEPEGGVKVDKAIDLTTAESAAVVERVTAKNDPFPSSFDIGSVTFHSAATVGKEVTGEFAVTFSNGKTLNGGFEAKLEDVAF
jgi:hypothetical protein